MAASVLRPEVSHRSRRVRSVPEIGTARARLRSSAEWRAYFEANAAALMEIPWERGAELSVEELKVIAASVQIFQIGESSEGRHLLDREAVGREPGVEVRRLAGAHLVPEARAEELLVKDKPGVRREDQVG